MGLAFLTLILMLILAYAFMREGAVTSFCMMCNVFLAGVLAFNFWEPIADQFDEMFAGSALAGYEDFLCLAFLFSLILALLRLLTHRLVPTQVEFAPQIQQIGSILIGLFTGYLLAGFMTCVLQTLPWNERFMSFDPRVATDASAGKARRWMPPDRVWLAMMHRLSEGGLTQGGPAFDAKGSFVQRYARFRRYTEDREPLLSAGEAEPK